MDEVEFERMEIGSLFLKLYYHNKGEDDNRRFYGEVIRLSTMQMMNLQISKGHKLQRPEELWRFPWEMEEGQGVELSPQEREERMKYLCEVARRHLG